MSLTAPHTRERDSAAHGIPHRISRHRRYHFLTHATHSTHSATSLTGRRFRQEDGLPETAPERS